MSTVKNILEDLTNDPLLADGSDEVLTDESFKNEKTTDEVSREVDKEVTTEVGSDVDGDESTDGCVDQLTLLLDPLSFTENSGLYVVTVDGVPRFYVKDEQSATEKMWTVARKLASTQFFAGYRTNFLKISDNELELIGGYRFFIISYDTLLHNISYNKVHECP